jgi:hypothetical protein
VARELKSNPFYTGEKLISECQKAIDKYGISVKLVYVYLDFKHAIGYKYKALHNSFVAEQKLEMGVAWAYVDCDGDESLVNKVLELLRWLVYSNPNDTSNLAECAAYLVAMSSMATRPPLQTREGKQSFVCSEDGKPFVFFDSREPTLNDLNRNVITKTTSDDNALKHFEKYPDCQWTMVWDDVLGAIQMAARDHCLTNKIADICSNVNADSKEIGPAKPVEKVMRLGKWFDKATDGKINSEQLRKAIRDGRIKGCKQEGDKGSLWLYPTDAVKALHNNCAKLIDSALKIEENTAD